MTQPAQMTKSTDSPARARARFIERLYDEFERRGWHRQGAKATWDEVRDAPIPQTGVTLHRVGTEGDAGADLGLKQGKLADFYADSDNVVAPRSYKTDREEQALRWISTLVFKYLNHLELNPVEVQAAVHDGGLYVAANSGKSNTELAGIAGKCKTGAKFVTRILGELDRFERAAGSALTFSEREERHRAKLRLRILDESTRWDEDYPLVCEALAEPVVVCGAGEEGLHAERRISRQVGETPTHIAGVKRPCVACYLDLFEGRGVRPGPYWPSEAANIDIDEYADRDVAALADRIEEAIPDTYVTLLYACPNYVMAMSNRGSSKGKAQKVNSVTDEYNSDSDTGEDGEPLETEENLTLQEVKALRQGATGGGTKRKATDTDDGHTKRRKVEPTAEPTAAAKVKVKVKPKAALRIVPDVEFDVDSGIESDVEFEPEVPAQGVKRKAADVIDLTVKKPRNEK
ncbi:hypothetical protein AB0I61_35575 [Polymorphospora rubra]|uniref:hypothetical protein n=1 Tax=Polymorphospora rubra TaxID=338584 RepID=UPI0033F431D8